MDPQRAGPIMPHRLRLPLDVPFGSCCAAMICRKIRTCLDHDSEGCSVLQFILTHMRWQRDLPDFRDYTLDEPEVIDLLGQIKRSRPRRRKLPTSIDLRDYFTEVEDQGPLNASRAFAVLALVEYFEARAHGRVIAPSKLFLYQTTLESQGTTDDASAGLRATLKALARCGTPPAVNWPTGPKSWRKS